MSLESYEREQFEKLMTVIRAGMQNPTCKQVITISTDGYEPKASVSLAAHIIEKFLKAPAAKS